MSKVDLAAVASFNPIRFVSSSAEMAASNMCTLFGPRARSAKPLKGHWRCGD
jgi:hypothetical protein